MWRAILLSTLFAFGAVSHAAVDGQQIPAAPALPPAATPSTQPATPPAALPRGALLYENHCQGCHESRLHVRERRRATTRAALRGWVTHWSNHLGLGWDEAEIDDVVDHLNRRYYKLPPDRAP
jgi:mono/diheme cytochrome c family protein